MPFTLNMPKLSPTMEKGILAKWHAQEGDFVKAGQLLFEVATDKATIEYNALDEGFLRQILVPAGKEAVVNGPVAVFTAAKEESLEGYHPPQAQVPKKEEVKRVVMTTQTPLFKKSADRLRASPLARKLAIEQQIDLSRLTGTGPGGRIMSRDLNFVEPLGEHEEALSPIRQVIANRLQEAKSTIPHYYLSITLDAAPLIEKRMQLKHEGTTVSFNDLLIKAVAATLAIHRDINTGYNPRSKALIRFPSIDISVAVDTPQGLITPILFEADQKSIIVISEEVKKLAEKAKQGKLQPQEFQGGSFTISNLGMWGITSFQAVINPPQGAILAIGAIIEIPVIKNGSIVLGHQLTLTLSADHRVIDGAQGAAFLKTLKTLVEGNSY